LPPGHQISGLGCCPCDVDDVDDVDVDLYVGSRVKDAYMFLNILTLVVFTDNKIASQFTYLLRKYPSSCQDFKVDLNFLLPKLQPPHNPPHHQPTDTMGRAKKVRKFVATKRVIGKRDARLRENQIKQLSEVKKKPKTEDVVREVSVSNPQALPINLP